VRPARARRPRRAPTPPTPSPSPLTHLRGGHLTGRSGGASSSAGARASGQVARRSILRALASEARQPDDGHRLRRDLREAPDG
jgi:hypothetical protein